jgi:hypothetical protein
VGSFWYNGDTVVFGKPLSKQPELRITDANGNPIVNKSLVAFSWPSTTMD